MKRLCLLIASLAFGVSGCATTGKTSHPSADFHRITADELRVALQSDAFQLIQNHRPRWIAQRGPMSINDPTAGMVVVYLDGVRAGYADFLRQISVISVEQMEYLNGPAAAARYGLGHAGGAILVTTRLR
jgi:hypothetical protein